VFGIPLKLQEKLKCCLLHLAKAQKTKMCSMYQAHNKYIIRKPSTPRLLCFASLIIAQKLLRAGLRL
jgi:hypothetical protein